jgi:S-adenosylmethionine decarboxylase proenzyme
MNSSHPIITKGTHIILDLKEIENNEILKYEKDIREILDIISIEFKLNVVGRIIHQFEPFGVTGVYVLSESHLSIHTFVEEKKIAMDLYTCKDFDENERLITFIKNIFHPCVCDYKIIDR